MVSIIKKQIIKHLSKFTKNLSPDNFNFSTLKGEGELTDLQLNEIVLTDLLELPCWLRLTNAWCNRVCFRIQWAKLKSVPIQLSLDEVRINVETCEELRKTSSTQGLSSYSGAAKYSFIHKVIDGMTVTVNTVQVHFISPAFTSSVELSRIVVKSKSPEWKNVELPGTRFKDSNKGYVLLFKELEWQNVRIEAKSTKDTDLTPLRLITNKAICRITLKKRLNDSLIMGSRLVITLDDLLWVLTDFQLRAALHFLDSLTGLIKRATEQTRKKKAARKLQVLPEYQETAQFMRMPEQSSDRKSTDDKISKFDVIETSYHFIAHKIDLHISDDNKDGRSVLPELQNGASLQVTLWCFRIDFYPYHLASAGRSHWPMYKEESSNHSEWLKNAQNYFYHNIMAFTASHCLPSESTPENSSLTPELIKTFVRKQLSTLMTSCFILRISNFNVSQVSITGSKIMIPRDFISAQRKGKKGDKELYNLPYKCSLIHAEFTYYYYPDDEPFPVPTPKFCAHIEPIQMTFDMKTILWLNAFALALQQSLLSTSNGDAVMSSLMTFDVHIVAIQFRILFESQEEHIGQKDRPKILQFQVSRTAITNVRHYEPGFKTDLESSLNSILLASLFFQKTYPNSAENHDLPFQIDKFSNLLKAGSSNVQPAEVSNFKQLRDVINKGLNFAEPKEIWCVHLDPLSGLFYGAKAVGKDRPVAFLDNLPITLWLELKLLPHINIHALANVASLVSLQINHYQYLFLLRLNKTIEDLSNYLAVDSTRILKRPSDLILIAGTVIPQVEVTLLMPSQTPGKSSSGGDMESFIPDSSSLQDENWQSSSSVINEKPKIPGDIKFTNETDTFGKTNGDLKPIWKEEPQKEHRKMSIGHISFGDDIGVASGLKKAWKKSVGNIMASLDIHSNVQSPPDDNISSVSIKSDLSSDSENYPMFNVDDPYECIFEEKAAAVEEATECLEDEDNNTNTITSPSERDSLNSSFKRHDLVSICTFKLRKVELLFQILGSSSTIKLQVNNVATGECSSISWDEFQCKFNSRHRGWVENLVPESSVHPQIQLRFNRILPVAYPLTQSLPEADIQVDIRVQNLQLDMTVGSVSGLVELVEDEIKPTPLPANILLEDIKIHLTDDRPANQINAIESSPVDVVVEKLLVKRDLTGLIIIPASLDWNSSRDKKSRIQEDLSVVKKLQMENEELRRRLSALERLAEENYQLKRYQEENETLRPSLVDAQNRVSSLLEDKKNLLDNVRSLQDQLSQSNRLNRR